MLTATTARRDPALRVAEPVRCVSSLIRVAVHAPDAITAAGASAVLRSADAVHLVTDSAMPHDVSVVVRGDATGSPLRLPAPASSAPCVLVADCVLADALPALVSRRVRVVLPRTGLTRTGLVGAIGTAARGGALLPPELLGTLLDGLARGGSSRAAASKLDSLEAEVLRLCAQGLSTMRISATLGYSERAVTEAVHRVKSRLGLRNRTHVVAWAIRAHEI